ncbi:ATPase, V0 complex, subunit E1/e2 [Thelephora terrestris]|uniref:ATPase, V0 complex, subunit E1/e2 n=1 Tax=Thelephora terrestris TaxID=56493 RepID=A0A9P6HPC4_9AGAM|nr:ATPase, V0 complex, subunit E1/e2 [Thelephora terrestris]
MSGYNVLFVLVVVAALMVTSWVFTPKGPNQTLIRTSSLLALACCYLIWMITYMAQLHPLIAPVFAVGHE